MVAQLLEKCRTKQDSRDLIGGLFEAMNTRDKTTDDRYQGVAYFNGGLFDSSSVIQLDLGDLAILYEVSKNYDWAHIAPAIFGTLFERKIAVIFSRVDDLRPKAAFHQAPEALHDIKHQIFFQ